MRYIALSFTFLLLLCVPVHAQATAGPGEGAPSTGGDFTTGQSSGTFTGSSDDNFTTGPSDGTFTTGPSDGTFTTQNQPGTQTTDPQTPGLENSARPGDSGLGGDRPVGTTSAGDQSFTDRTEMQLDEINTRIENIRGQRLQSIEGLDQETSDQLAEIERRRDALQNDLSGASEGAAGLNNQTQIESELRELDRDITRMEQGI